MLHTKKMRTLFAAADESGDGVLEAWKVKQERHGERMHVCSKDLPKCIKLHQHASSTNQDLSETRYGDRQRFTQIIKQNLSAAHVAKMCSGSGRVQGDHYQPRYQARPSPFCFLLCLWTAAENRNQMTSGYTYIRTYVRTYIHYITLHYITLHNITQHNITKHNIT